jgi:tryptophanyl-tRNA synthetase
VAVSGDRPTGRLHLGHLIGSLRDRLALQETHRCYFLVADLHFLTTHAGRTAEAGPHTAEIVLDWMSAGLDPGRSAFVLQSAVPEIAELAVVLSMLCPVPRARRIPTLKEKIAEGNLGESYSLGLLAYPVLMAADVLAFRATAVPVGEDQLPHLELVRELARRFNRAFGPAFEEPRPFGGAPRLVGTDGARKMSKSAGNAIFLSDDPATVARRVRGMFTDPRRIRGDVPGTVEGNPVFEYHDRFNPDRAEVEDLKARYRAGRVGDVEVKDRLAKAVNAVLDPIRERRRQLESRRAAVPEILAEGSRRARRAARQTLEEVLHRMGIGLPAARRRLTA